MRAPTRDTSCPASARLGLRAPNPDAVPSQEVCFTQIRAGLHAYHDSLGAVLRLLPNHTTLVETLQLDAANLSSNIQQQVRRGGTRRGGGWGQPGPLGDTAALCRRWRTWAWTR